jgi:hypothetical protein
MSKPREQSYKQFAKGLVETVLTEGGIDVELDPEIPPSTQTIYMVFEPDGRMPEHRPGDCLERIATTGAGMMERFAHIVQVDDIASSLYKRSGLYHHRLQRARASGQPRPEVPYLWMMTVHQPRSVMHEYEAEPMTGWPPGFWTLRREHRLYLVALAELPRTPETLSLRLMGGGAMHEQALQDFADLPRDSPLALALGPLIEAARRDAEAQKPSKGNARALVRVTHGRWKQEGFERGLEEGYREGWAAALLRLLERRFGTVPEAVIERMEQASVDAFQRWFVRALDAVSFDEVFGS